MCFYNPPFLSMAHMGMGPEYQPDDAGFSATWPEASIRNSSSKETVCPPVCSPHKNEFFMVTSCWNLITMLQYATVIYGINISKYGMVCLQLTSPWMIQMDLQHMVKSPSTWKQEDWCPIIRRRRRDCWIACLHILCHRWKGAETPGLMWCEFWLN